MSELLIINKTQSRLPRARIQRLISYLRRHLRKFKAASDGIEIVVISPAMMKRINKQFRKKNYATDVLSFNGAPGLGAIALCDSVVRKQAKKHGLSVAREYDYLIIHGFLHLLGFDHELGVREEKKMMDLQDKLFSRFKG